MLGRMPESHANSVDPTPDTVHLRDLVAHSHALDASDTVETAQATFTRLDIDFLAVLAGGRLLGLCARRELIGSLGSRFGFALNAKRPVGEFLLSGPLIFSTATAITELFKRAADRPARSFYDDIVLVDEHDAFVGLIAMHTAVRLQTEFLLRNLDRVESSRAEVAAKNRQLEDDLCMAREVQLALLPNHRQTVTVSDRCLQFAHFYRPSCSISGDFFDTLDLGSGSAGVLICDVMGHGVRSALITTMLRALIESLRPVARDPGEFLSCLNRDLTRMLRRAGGLIFVTAAYAVVDLPTQRLRYSQAGHPAPLHWQAATHSIAPLPCPDESAGPALGLMDEFNFATIEFPFALGDRLLLFTDGIAEARSSADEEFGTARMLASLAAHHEAPLDLWLEALVADAAALARREFDDDLCLVAVACNRASP